MRSFILRSGLLAALLCLIPASVWADNGRSVPQYLQVKVMAVCQQAAVEGLMEPVEKVDSDTLLVLLKARSQKVRGIAIYTLGDIRERRAVEPLIAVLEDQDPNLRRMAAHALGKINDPRAVYPLAYMLNNPNERVMVRCVAASALGRFPGEQANRVLLASYPRAEGRVHNVIGTMLSSR
ncbi:MAG: HEAT repeat domain-containing protein [Proteobacteria bacterium]|nr:HEAT repeat domain-containing protein [Pseudomonadota bacterium]